MLDKVATALQVPIEELTAAPRGGGPALREERRCACGARATASIRQLLPDPIPGMLIDRMELPAGGRIPGVPHMPGTREYLTCERGEIVLAVAGEAVDGWQPGDVVVFRGDQRHSYRNAGRETAIGYSVVVLAR